MDLDAFVKAVFSGEKQPIVLYSECEYRLMAEKVIQDIVDKNSKYYNAARFFSMYPAQKWADSVRKELKLDSDSLQKALDEETEYFGIYTCENLSVQHKNLRLTDEMSKYVESCLLSVPLSPSEKAVVDAIFYNRKTSKYLVNRYLKSAMTKLLENSYEQFDKYAEKIEQIVKEVDDDLYFAYHSIEDFLYSVRKMKEDRVRSYDVNSKVAFSAMKDAINALKKYPFSKDVHRIISSTFCDKTEMEIAKDLNRSRTYVRSHMQDGYKALSILFWGYSVRVNML